MRFIGSLPQADSAQASATIDQQRPRHRFIHADFTTKPPSSSHCEQPATPYKMQSITAQRTPYYPNVLLKFIAG
jgi:hypothetical protein